MIRTGDEYLESTRDGREVHIDGERVEDVTTHPPQERDPDMLLHVVGETDAGIVVRGAGRETAGAHSNQAFTRPTIANWGSDAPSEDAVGFTCDLGSPGTGMICRTGFAGRAPMRPRNLDSVA